MLLLTISVGSCSCERSFSALSRLDLCCTATTTDDRLCVLASLTKWSPILHMTIWMRRVEKVPLRNFSAISWWEQVNFQWDDDEVGFYRAISLQQQSSDRHVAPPRHIILIPSQPVFALSPKYCILSWEATNTNFIVFGLTRFGFEPTITPWMRSLGWFKLINTVKWR